MNHNELEENRLISDNLLNILNAISDGIVVVDSVGIVLFCNDAACSLLEKPVDCLIGSQFAFHSILNSKNEISVQIHSPSFKELKILKKQINLNGQPVFLLTIKDFTSEHRKEKTLLVSEERYRILSEMVSDMAYSLHVSPNKEISFEWFTHTFTDITGYQENDFISDYKWADLIVAEDLHSIEMHLNRILQNNNSIAEFRFIKKNGEIIWVRNHSKPIYDPKLKRVVRIFGTLKDITDKKLLELEVNASLSFLQTLIDTIPNPIFYKNSDLIYLGCNKAFSEIIIGKPKEEIIGKHFNDLKDSIPPDLAAIYIEQDKKLLSSSDVQYYEENVKCSDGSIRRFYFYKAVYLDSADKQAGIIGVMLDISDLRQVEEAYRSLVENSLQGMVIIQNGTIVYSNKALTEMTGYAKEELSKLSVEEVRQLIYHEDRDEVWNRHLARMSGNDVLSRYHFRAVRKNGEVFWVEVYASIVQFKGQAAIQAVFLDISDRMIAEKKLISDEEKFSKAFQLSPDLIVIDIFPDNIIIDVNDSFIATTGYSKEEIIGKTATDLGLWMENNRYEFQVMLKSNGIIKNIEAKFRMKNGEIKDFLIFSVLLEIQNQTCSLTIMRDITNSKISEALIKKTNVELEERVSERTSQLESLLLELKNEISMRQTVEDNLINARNEVTAALNKEKELNELKSRFISMISHEYRTPLTIISTSTYLLEKFYESRSDDKFHQKLKMVHSAINTMTRLLEGVLSVGKIQNRELAITVSKVNVKELCSGLIEEISNSDKHKHFFELNATPGGYNIETDRKIVRLIIQNLLNNAVKFSPDNTIIKVEISETSKWIVLNIIDNGIGIPADELERIYDPFFRGRNINVILGAGLGLAVVKGCVELIGASIKVESKIDEGSKFTIGLYRE